MAAAGAAAPRAASGEWIIELHFEIHDGAILFNDPDGARLIQKVTARRADGSVYWIQVFYRSSGSSSRYKGIWFPFLGISKRRDAPFFTKGLPFPDSWPADDVFRKKERISNKDSELIGRFGTRSFMLAANTLNAFDASAETRYDIATRVFEGVEPTSVDPALQTIIVENSAYDDAKWEEIARGLEPATPEAVNAFIGADIYINYGKAPEERLDLASVALPNYVALSMMIGGGRRKSRRAGKRITKRTRRRD